MQRPTIFSHLSEDDLAQLYHAATIKHFQKDQYIIKAGEECNCLYIVLDGLVRIVYRNNTDINIINNNDFFGDMTFQEKCVNLYSAIAVEHVTLMEINHSIVDHLPGNVQLVIYKKLGKSSTHHMYHISTHNDKMDTRNTELTTYIDTVARILRSL